MAADDTSVTNHAVVSHDFNADDQASFTPEEMAAKRAFYNYTVRDPKAREREGHSIFFKDAGGGGPFWVRRRDEYGR